MTNDDVIRMAQEAGFVEYELDDGTTNAFDVRYEAFADLVAESERDKYEVKFKKLMQLHEVRESQPNKPCCLVEREECAKVCDGVAADVFTSLGKAHKPWMEAAAKECAEAIRARGNT